MSGQGKVAMAESPSTFTNELAVVYLARFAEGPRPVATFIASYQRHRAGVAHDSVVIRKGFPDGKTAQDKILEPAFANAISISDDGFDINAYAEAAARLPHKYVVFLNTFSEIASDDWLQKLRSALSDSAVGIAGATGSYESLHGSMKRVNKGWWLFQNRILPSPTGVRRIFRTIRKLLPKRFVREAQTRIISYFVASTAKPNYDRTLDDKFETFWQRELKAGGAYEFLNRIPGFPNIHIRTNAFMIERRIFLDTQPGTIKTKIDSYMFESGPDSLTQQILRLGLKVLVVGADGRSYDIDQWTASGTFRLGTQHNLLVKDNQTRAFEHMHRSSKLAYVGMTWGDGQKSATP
jgi:hypothetical protein